MERKTTKNSMTDCPVSRRSRLRNQIFEIAAYSALAMICAVASWPFLGSDAVQNYAWVALIVCFGSCIGPCIWQIGSQDVLQSDFSILVTMGLRFSILLGAVAVSTATKWQQHNSFCNCLLGYYFPFLLLQSALLIRNQSFSHPPQS